MYLYTTLQNDSTYCPQKNWNYVQQIYCVLQLICFCLVSHSESTWRKSISTSKDFSLNALNALLQAFSYPFQNEACKAYMYNSKQLFVMEWQVTTKEISLHFWCLLSTVNWFWELNLLPVLWDGQYSTNNKGFSSILNIVQFL